MITNFTSTEFPRQKVSFNQKMSTWEKGEKKWYEVCTDNIINNANNYFNGNRSSFKNKRENYRIYNNQYESLDFTHLTNPFPEFSMDKEKLKCIDRIQPFDLISSYFKLLLGEEVERVFEPIIAVINPEAVNEKLEEKEKVLKEYIQEYLTKAIDPNLDEENKKAQMELIEAKVMDLGTINYRSKKEIEATHLFNAVRAITKADQEFIKGIKDVFLTSEEFYSIDEIAGQPRLKRVNPLKLYAEFEHDEHKLSKAVKICEWDRMPISKVIDEYYEYLDETQISELESRTLNIPAMQMTNSPIDNPGVIESINSLNNDAVPGVDVYKCTWKSMSKHGIFSYFTEDGQSVSELVDENFEKPNIFFGEEVKWFWISEYWSTTKIEDIYIKVGANKTRFGNIQNLSECKSGYAGSVYEADNAVAVSMMDRLKPWIYLYISTWFGLEEVLKQNRGNLPIIDVAMIPDGWEPEKWMFYVTKLGYSFMNSFNEGKKGQATGKLAGNLGHSGNTTINLDKGNAIQSYISVLEYIERKVGFTAGIPPQRLGEIQSKELVGNTERVINQSSYITQYMIELHNNTKLEALEMLVNLSKTHLSENQILQYMSDDNSMIMHQIDPDIEFCDLGLFLTNNAKDIKSQEIMRDLLKQSLMSDKIEISEVASVLNSKSTAEIERKLKKADAIRRKNIQAEQQQRQAEIESNERLEMEKLNREDMNKQLDRENKIQVAEITVLSRQSNLDLNNNNVMDSSEIAKNNLESSRLHFEMAQAKEQNKQDAIDQQLKNKELDMKYALGKEKNEIDKIKYNKMSVKSKK